MKTAKITVLPTWILVLTFAVPAQAVTCLDLFKTNSETSARSLAPIPQKGPEFHAYALTKASEARTFRFKEFEMVHEVAARHGVRIWLWGQSASAYSGFVFRLLGTEQAGSPEVKLDVLRMFDYSMPLQLTIDGSVQTAKAVEQDLKTTFASSTAINNRLLTVRSHRTEARSEISPKDLIGLPVVLRARLTSSQTTEDTLLEAIEIAPKENSRIDRTQQLETKLLREKAMGRINISELSADFSNADLSLSSRVLSRDVKSPRSSQDVKTREVLKSVIDLRDSVHGEDRIRYIETVGQMYNVLREQNLIDGHSHLKYLLRNLIHAPNSPRLRKVAAVEYLMSVSGAPLLSLLKMKEHLTGAEYSEILIELKLWRQSPNSRKRAFVEKLDLIQARADRGTLKDLEKAGLRISSF